MLVSFAVCFPILFALIIGGMDVGMAELVGMQLQYAVQAAAYCAGIQDPNCTDPPSTLAYASTVSNMPVTDFTIVWSAQCGVLVSTTHVYVGYVIPNVRYSFVGCYVLR